MIFLFLLIFATLFFVETHTPTKENLTLYSIPTLHEFHIFLFHKDEREKEKKNILTSYSHTQHFSFLVAKTVFEKHKNSKES